MDAADPPPVWMEIRRADLLVLLAVAHAALERVTATRPLPERTWELAQAIEVAERALLAAGTQRPPDPVRGPSLSD